MKRHLVVSLRVILMTTGLLGVFGLYKATLAGAETASVFETVYANCIVILVSLIYYCILKLALHSCRPRRGARRVSRILLAHDQNNTGYLDLHQISSTTDVVLGVPRLTIQNVWTLVYGVGFILFVTGYCILGQHPFCLACVGLGMSLLAIDEIICPRRPLNKLYASARYAALLAVLVSLLLVTVDLINTVLVTFVATLDLYSLVFGLCLPLTSQFLMVAVRDNRRYSIGSVFEVCEFGLPFTAFLGVFHLSVAYGQRYQIANHDRQDYNQSITTSLHGAEIVSILVRTDGPFLLFYSLAPLLVIPSLVAFISCILDGSAIDPLLSISLALCVQYIILCNTSPLGIYGTACCAVAIAIRVLADYTPVLGDHPSHCHNTQLSEQAVRDRDARLSEAEPPDPGPNDLEFSRIDNS